MTIPASAPAYYDRRTVVLHWLTAALVLALWCLGQTIDWFSKTDKVYARSTHIALGVALAVVLSMRIRWRFFGHGVHLPPAGLGFLDRVATLTHWLLYALLVITVILGVTNAWERGDSIFNLFKISSFAPADKQLRALIEDWHAYAANALLAVAMFHALAALSHHFAWKDGVLRRMLAR